MSNLTQSIVYASMIILFDIGIIIIAGWRIFMAFLFFSIANLASKELGRINSARNARRLRFPGKFSE